MAESLDTAHVMRRHIPEVDEQLAALSQRSKKFAGRAASCSNAIGYMLRGHAASFLLFGLIELRILRSVFTASP